LPRFSLSKYDAQSFFFITHPSIQLFSCNLFHSSFSNNICQKNIHFSRLKEKERKKASNTVSAKRHRSESRMRFLCDELITVEGTYGARANSNVLFPSSCSRLEPKSRHSAIFADA